jgi:hypothetical protein
MHNKKRIFLMATNAVQAVPGSHNVIFENECVGLLEGNGGAAGFHSPRASSSSGEFLSELGPEW